MESGLVPRICPVCDVPFEDKVEEDGSALTVYLHLKARKKCFVERGSEPFTVELEGK